MLKILPLLTGLLLIVPSLYADEAEDKAVPAVAWRNKTSLTLAAATISWFRRHGDQRKWYNDYKAKFRLTTPGTSICFAVPVARSTPASPRT